MFSKILKSAKIALQPAAPASLQYPETNLFPPTPKTPARAKMVTTRRTALDSDADVSTPSAQIQASSRKRQRMMSTPSEIKPSSSAKKRKLGVVTESPVIDLQSDGEDEDEIQVMPTPKRRRSSGTKDVNINIQKRTLEKLKSPGRGSAEISLLSDEEQESKPISSSQQVHSLLSDEESEEVVQPKSSQRDAQSPAKIFKSPKANISIDHVPTGNVEAPSKAEEDILPESKHRRFGSPQPVVEIPSSDPNDREEESEEEEDSDDEAPEEVETREAADEAKKAVRAAAKAVEEQRAAERKSRQERDLAMKKQAELNKKRKRKSANEEDQDGLEDNGAELDATQAETVPAVEETVTNDIAMEDRPADHPLTIESSKSQKIDRNDLPELLPLEYLQDTPDEDTTVTTTKSARPKPKKTKFLELAEKKPKDKRIGSTTYRVREAKPDSKLAPKASKTAMSLKEAWLSGGVRKNGKDGSARKPMKSSFFVNGKSGAGRR